MTNFLRVAGSLAGSEGCLSLKKELAGDPDGCQTNSFTENGDAEKLPQVSAPAAERFYERQQLCFSAANPRLERGCNFLELPPKSNLPVGGLMLKLRAE